MPLWIKEAAGQPYMPSNGTEGACFHEMHCAHCERDKVMNGNQLSLGRNHATADSISMTEFGGFDPCFRVDIRWNDGGHVYVIYDTKDEALAHVRRLGWA